MPRNFRKIDKCYEYLQAQAGNEIIFRELLNYTGWSQKNLSTNISKRIREFLVDKFEPGTLMVDRKYYVDRNIKLILLADFRDLFRQKNQIFSKYNHVIHDLVKIYDFYLPLRNENLLRQNLDNLFYEDTLIERLEATNLDDLTPIYEFEDGESIPDYYKRVAREASDLFWGYSVSHVGGRFRTGDGVLTKAEAAKKKGKAYLVDETTAIVRFIFPYEEDRQEYHRKLDQLFLVLFVKAITESTPDEDEIWLLENIGSTKLHRYIKIPWG